MQLLCLHCINLSNIYKLTLIYLLLFFSVLIDVYRLLRLKFTGSCTFVLTTVFFFFFFNRVGRLTEICSHYDQCI